MTSAQRPLAGRFRFPPKSADRPRVVRAVQPLCLRFCLVAIVFACSLLIGMSPVRAQEMFNYPETRLRGQEVASMSVPPERCRDFCQQNAGCDGFEHSSQTGMCRLYAVVTSAADDRSSVAGTKRLISNYRDPTNPPQPVEEEEEEQEAWFLARFSGIDLFGNDIDSRGIKLSSEAACARRCRDDNSCRAYTFNDANNHCFLKNGFEFAQRYGNASSALYFKALPSQANKVIAAEWRLFVGRDFLGGDLYQSPAQNYKQCVMDCKADSGCFAYTWVARQRGRNFCFLKNSNFDSRPARNQSVVSAHKINETVTPDSITPVGSRD